MNTPDGTAESRHERLIAEYFAMWVTRDFAAFDSLFTDDCHYEECYGPVYDGLGELHSWIDAMLARQTVSDWTIHEFIHAEDGRTVTVTWTFSDDQSTFDGVSIIRFAASDRITGIREFEATHQRRHPYRTAPGDAV
jgi:ketosteroid isomerase-like protein